MITCFVLAGQIVLSLPHTLNIVEDNGTLTPAEVGQTIIFPKDAGVQIYPDNNGATTLEFFQMGESQEDTKIIRPFLPDYDEVVAALADCQTD